MSNSRLHTRGKRNRGLSLDRNHGAEGPRHDPYSWTELIVHKNGHTIVLRLGSLGYVRLSIDGKPVKKDACRDYEQASMLAHFTRLTGLTPDSFEKIYNERFYFEDPMGHPSQYI